MRRQKVGTALLLAIGTLCLVIIFRPIVQDSNEENSEELHLEANPTSPEPLYTVEPPPRCEIVISASNVTGFYDLPGHIQDFLFYRHCRHFPMLLNVPNKCGGPKESTHVFILLVIKSSPTNYARREVLRETWAAERMQSGKLIRTVFVTGTSGDGYEKLRVNKLLQLENHEKKDILQWDFKDSSYNLTLKQILFMQWMDRWCPDAHFIFSGDDDIFANTDNMVEYLKGLGEDAGSKHLFVGQVMSERPDRYRPSKYYIPVQVYAPDTYPPYCSGGGILRSRFTVRAIHKMSHSIALLPIEDAYLGICLEKAGLKPASHIGVMNTGLHIPSHKVDLYNPCYYREILLVHRFLPHEIYLMWHEIHQDDLECENTL